MITPEILWLIAGVLLILSEFAAPGVVLIFFGVGAVVTAVTTWLGWTTGIGSQSVVFGASSLVFLFALRRYIKRWFVGKFDSTEGDLDDDYTGHEATVVHEIPADGLGRVEIKGAEWRARASEAIAPGQVVIIERREGLTLHVRPR